MYPIISYISLFINQGLILFYDFVIHAGMVHHLAPAIDCHINHASFRKYYPAAAASLKTLLKATSRHRGVFSSEHLALYFQPDRRLGGGCIWSPLWNCQRLPPFTITNSLASSSRYLWCFCQGEHKNSVEATMLVGYTAD